MSFFFPETRGSGSRAKKIAAFLCVLLLSFPVFSQETGAQTLPDLLRAPERGEAPRYPEDLVIGTLGRGEAPEDAYLLAQRILGALADGNRDAPVLADNPSVFGESVLGETESIRPQSYRLGGGRIEADGCVSFIVRFVGTQESITGELFLRRAEAEEEGGFGAGRWLPDDILLEDKRAITEIRDGYRYNFSPYERFY